MATPRRKIYKIHCSQDVSVKRCSCPNAGKPGHETCGPDQSAKCPVTRIRKCVCPCGHQTCGSNLCSKTGKSIQKQYCPCGGEKCGASFCFESGSRKYKAECPCNADGCGGTFCGKSGKRLARRDCPCGSTKCGANLCYGTGRKRNKSCCKCGGDKCGYRYIKYGFTREQYRSVCLIKVCEFPGCLIQESARALCSDHYWGSDGTELISPENYRGEVCQGHNRILRDLDAHPEWASEEAKLFIARRPFSRKILSTSTKVLLTALP